jgi:hypothetical protein
MRVSSATSRSAADAPESGVFRGIFAVQLHAKVRAYAARRCGPFAAGRPTLAAVDSLPRCGLLAR